MADADDLQQLLQVFTKLLTTQVRMERKLDEVLAEFQDYEIENDEDHENVIRPEANFDVWITTTHWASFLPNAANSGLRWEMHEPDET